MLREKGIKSTFFAACNSQLLSKGLAACNSQTASPFGCLNNFYFKILSNFLGSLHFALSV